MRRTIRYLHTHELPNAVKLTVGFWEHLLRTVTKLPFKRSIEIKHFKDEAQTALFKDPVRTAL